MPRYRLTVEYNGAPFSGWQRQNDRPSVQGAIEDALAAASEPGCTVYGAGRTDAGVHAYAQAAHVDTARDWDANALWHAINAGLKSHPVAVLDCQPVSDEWHARFSATHRHYEYRIAPRRPHLALDHGLAWNVKVPLDIDAMNQAAAHLLGTHDFTTFRSTECQSKSPVKTLDRCEAVAVDTPTGPQLVVHVSALSFLHNQVRSFVGSLERVGRGKWTPDDLRGALEARTRSACGPVAPAHGLYLARVDYA